MEVDLTLKERIRRSDVALVTILAALTVLLRLPFASHSPNEFDSVQYVLSTVPGAPGGTYLLGHLPGYLLYVVLGGKVLGSLMGSANAGFVALAILASASTVVITYLLAQALLGRLAGVAAALLLMTNPVFWLRGEIAVPYVIDSLVGVLLALPTSNLTIAPDAELIDRIGLAYGMLGLDSSMRQEHFREDGFPRTLSATVERSSPFPLDLQQKLDDILAGREPQGEPCALAAHYRLDYIWWGPYERALVGPAPNSALPTTRVYESEGTAIYEVHCGGRR